MDIQNTHQYGQYQLAKSNSLFFGQDPKSGIAPEKSALDNLLTINAVAFSIETEIFSQERIDEQVKSFQEYSVTRINFSTIEIESFLQSEDETKSKKFLENDFENTFWGVGQTASRLADFVISGGGNDLNKIRSGREGIITGFKEAEKMWGGELPDISYRTLDKALEDIDNRIHELGGNVIDIAA